MSDLKSSSGNEGEGVPVETKVCISKIDKKSVALELQKRIKEFDRDILNRVKARMKVLSLDPELEKQTIKDLQRKFK